MQAAKRLADSHRVIRPTRIGNDRGEPVDLTRVVMAAAKRLPDSR